MNGASALEVESLRVDFVFKSGAIHAVRDVSLAVARGETVGILGESGSGKSVTGRALMGLLQESSARVDFKRFELGGSSVPLGQSQQARSDIAMVFQNPFTALNPVFKIGHQLSDVLVKTRGFDKRSAHRRAIDLLDLVRIPAARDRMNAYPHELSGGMQQRIVIALALALEPKVMVADEPTTALDVTIQAQILDLLEELRVTQQMALIFISHDIDVVAEVSSRIYVMYSGRIVEEGPSRQVVHAPRHPYSIGLLESAPRIGHRTDRLVTILGSPPSAAQSIPGCAFHPRCRFARDICAAEAPPVVRDAAGFSRCHFTSAELMERMG
jgi:oligopeptide transport system ATP-binding protein